MNEKNFRTRMQMKNDVAENWAKAENFIPLAGEIIVYSDLNKIKIGNGQTLVNDLPFIESGNSSSSVEITKEDFVINLSDPEETEENTDNIWYQASWEKGSYNEVKTALSNNKNVTIKGNLFETNEETQESSVMVTFYFTPNVANEEWVDGEDTLVENITLLAILNSPFIFDGEDITESDLQSFCYAIAILKPDNSIKATLSFSRLSQGDKIWSIMEDGSQNPGTLITQSAITSYIYNKIQYSIINGTIIKEDVTNNKGDDIVTTTSKYFVSYYKPDDTQDIRFYQFQNKTLHLIGDLQALGATQTEITYGIYLRQLYGFDNLFMGDCGSNILICHLDQADVTDTTNGWCNRKTNQEIQIIAKEQTQGLSQEEIESLIANAEVNANTQDYVASAIENKADKSELDKYAIATTVETRFNEVNNSLNQKLTTNDIINFVERSEIENLIANGDVASADFAETAAKLGDAGYEITVSTQPPVFSSDEERAAKANLITLVIEE